MTVRERARRARRARIIGTMLETAARSLGWQASPEDRITTALLAHQVSVRVPGLELHAWVTPELRLAIALGPTVTWNADVEARLRAALEQSAALVAGLLLEEWDLLRAACVERVERQGEADTSSGTARERSVTRPPVYARPALE